MYKSRVGCSSKSNSEKQAKPFCKCWDKSSAPISWTQLCACSCGEGHAIEWHWEELEVPTTSWIVLSNDQKQVNFHQFYSSGTAVARGNTLFSLNNHYYWEVKMLTDTYGTDIMIGVGTINVKMFDAQFRFTSLLGQDAESYGLSYKGAVRHDAKIVARNSSGFCRGSIVGVRLDMWNGTLEFYINRESQGISFYNLRRHRELFPMICSTAAQSSMRLIHASSWKASLLVDAAKILASSVRRDQNTKLPPGLWNWFRSHFWVTLPTMDSMLNEDEEQEMVTDRTVPVSRNLTNLAEILPRPYMNGHYVDGVENFYRVVLWGE